MLLRAIGRVLDAAITEAGVAAPDVTLTAETFLAMTKFRAKFIEKRLTNAEDRKLVAAIYDELKTTGRVENSLSEDDRTIRDLHRTEVLEPQLAQRNAAARRRVTGRLDRSEADAAADRHAKEATSHGDTTALELAGRKVVSHSSEVSAIRRLYRTRRSITSEHDRACAAAEDRIRPSSERKTEVKTAKHISLPATTSRRRRRSVRKWPNVSPPLGFIRSEISSRYDPDRCWPNISTIQISTLRLSLTGKIRRRSSSTFRGSEARMRSC